MLPIFYKHSIILLLLLLAAPLLFIPNASAQEPPTPALGYHIVAGDVEHIEAAKAAGAEFVVVVFNWDTIEPDPNNIYWEVPDAALRTAEYYGLDVVARLDRPPQWAFDDTNPTPWQLLAYEAFVRRVADRYADRLAGVIIWNEPNLSLEWNGRPPVPEGYVQMLKPAYRAIKAAAPNLPVIAAGLASTVQNDETTMNDLEFLQGIYDFDGGQYFDILAAHPYGFGRPPAENPAPDRLNFRRLELLREVMVANGDANKPVWATEMGWRTRAPNPTDAWQVVTPQQQSDYVFEAVDYAAKNYPWLEKIALWELNANGDNYGYYLWHGPKKISQAYQGLVAACTQEKGDSCLEPVQIPNTETVTILEPDVTIRLGDRDTLHPHWVHLHRGGQNFSPDWQGDFFLSPAQANRSYDLLLETMQVDQPTNRLQINGVNVAALRTRTRPDPTSTWVTQRFAVDEALLRPGQNSIQLFSGQRNPARHYGFWRWENFQFRNIRLTPPQQEPEPMFANWQPLPSPNGWSETNRLRPGLQNDFWLTGNRPGELWRGSKSGPNAIAELENEAANRTDLVFVDILPTVQGELAATNKGLVWRAAGQPEWESVPGAPDAYAYVLARHNGQLYAGFEDVGLWSASEPNGIWQNVALPELTVLDLAVSPDAAQIYAATSDGVYVKLSSTGSDNEGNDTQPEPVEGVQGSSEWQPLPLLPGDTSGKAGDPLKRFMTRIYAGQDGDVVVRNLDQLWRYPLDGLGSNPPAEWEPFGPPPLHETNKLFSVLNCCNSGAIVGTNLSGLWQLTENGRWQRIDTGIFDTTDATGLLQLNGNLYAAGVVALLQSANGGQSWSKVEGLPPTTSDLLIDPNMPEQWFAATPAGVYRSRDSGETWQSVSPPWTVWDMAFGADDRLFIARTGGVAWADDPGDENVLWQETDGMEEVLFLNVDPHPTDAAVLLAGTWGNDLGVSYNGGKTMRSSGNGLETLSVLDVLWHPLKGQLTVGTIEGLYRTDNFGQDWFKLPGALKQQTVYSLYQTENGTLWAGAANGLWRSPDYGVTWQRVDSLPEATVLRLGQITIDGETWLWAGTESDGLWLSNNQGETWQFGGLPDRTVYNIQVDPQPPGRLLAATDKGLLATAAPAGDFADTALPLSAGQRWIYHDYRYDTFETTPVTATYTLTKTVVNLQTEGESTIAKIEQVSTLNSASVSQVWLEEHPGYLNGMGSSLTYWLAGDGRNVYQEFSQPPDVDALAEDGLLLYRLPLTNGDAWYQDPDQRAQITDVANGPYVGKMFVTGPTSETVPAGTFDNCYQVTGLYNTGNTLEWLCSGIGVVKSKMDHAGTPFGYETVLIDCK